MPDQDLTPDFDLSFLTEIADGSNEFIVESIDMFLQQTPELIERIGDGIASGDLVPAAQAAHKLKPNLGFFGMTACQTMMQEIEAMAKKGDASPDLQRIYAEVKAIVDRSLIKLSEIKIEKEALL